MVVEKPTELPLIAEVALRSADIGYARPGDAVAVLGEEARKILPAGYAFAWDGESRDFVESASSFNFAFLLALALVYLVLAAQFESFRDPFVVMLTVPLAMTGALAGLLAWTAWGDRYRLAEIRRWLEENLPAGWFDEGFAEILSPTIVVGDRAGPKFNTYRSQVAKEVLRQDKLVPLRKFIRMSRNTCLT